MPVTEETSAPGGVQSERDAWVQALDKLCSDWKNKYKGEHVIMKTKIQRNPSIAEETENIDTGLESNGGFSGGNMTVIYPPAHYANTDPSSGGEDRLSAGDTSQSHPSVDYTGPVPKPRRSGKSAAGATGPDVSPPIPSPTSPGVVASSSPANPPPSPNRTAPSVPEPVSNESGSSAVTGPPPPSAPPPPPLPFKPKTNSSKPCTKAFHWDVVSSDKVTLLLNLHQKTKLPYYHKSKANSFLMCVN